MGEDRGRERDRDRQTGRQTDRQTDIEMGEGDEYRLGGGGGRR